MPKLKSPDTPRVEPAPPQYVPPSAGMPAFLREAVEAPFDDRVIRKEVENASYSLLDVREGKWCLMSFGSGANLRQFHSMEEGIAFVHETLLPRVRCLKLVSADNPLGEIRW